MGGLNQWVLGIGVAFMVAFVLRVIVANRNPNTPPPPTTPLPQPNAFDTYNEAAKRMASGDAVQEAFLAVVQTADPPCATPAQRAALLTPNRDALQLVRVGLGEAYVEPPLRRWDAVFPYHKEHRDMTRLLVLEGWTRLDAGDGAGAATSWLDALEFGQQVARGGPVLTRLVSVACQSIALRPLWHSLNRLDAVTAKTSARRLEAIVARRVPRAETWTEEKHWGQVILMALWRGEPGADHNLFAPEPTLDEDGDEVPQSRFSLSEGAYRQGVYFLWPKTVILNNYLGYMDRLIAHAKPPYGERGPAPALPPDLYTRRVATVFAPTDLKFAASEDAQSALLTAALALRAFRMETGAYPAALSEVVEAGYLMHVPNDPFAPDGAPLRYRRNEGAESYMLYSVGPDGVDDGGDPINNPNAATKNARFVVELDSKGDIVAGINVY